MTAIFRQRIKRNVENKKAEFNEIFVQVYEN